MTHRSDRVYLPPATARCDPGGAVCRQRQNCARYLASLPASGAKLENFAISLNMKPSGFCYMLVPLSHARHPVAQPAQPKVHPPLRGVL